ncbi:MAG TPA: DUF3100 domain-containing protein [Bacillales bacterium]|nr:DUF3100 domain-containing protein [Bacillales bacterium]
MWDFPARINFGILKIRKKEVNQMAVKPEKGGLTTSNMWLILGCTLVISIIAELIGTFKFQVGPGVIVLFPLIWAIVLAGFVSLQKWYPIPVRAQQFSAVIMEIGIMIFIVRLGTLIGPSLAKVFSSSAALLFQELGHIFGTVILALPIAILLKTGRASIGASYSIDREPNLAFIAERFGGNSDEYRGAVGVYVIGSIFGALYVGLLAGFLGGWNIFSPIALAMGAGVGSGSMMAAASSAIATEFPQYKDQILAFAGASNLITEVFGVYATIFISLPLAEVLYKFWNRLFFNQNVASAQAAAAVDATNETQHVENTESRISMSISNMVWIVLMISAIMLISNWVGTHQVHAISIVGMLFIAVITIISFLLKRLIPVIPAIVWASMFGLILTASFCPIAPTLLTWVKDIDFLAMVSPVLALVGLSIGKDIKQFKHISWRIIVVAFVAYTATFVFASLIAQVFILK